MVLDGEETVASETSGRTYDEISDRVFARAREIGDQLCDAAVVDGAGRLANWLGRRDIVDDALLARYSVRSGALGPEIYAGSGGVALFLTGLYAATGAPRFARISAAALRRSVLYLRGTSLPLHPHSFFAGHAGVLCAVRRLSALYPDADLGEERSWLEQTIADAEPPRSLDIIAGAAGGVLALIDAGAGEKTMGLARRCGDLLCDAAVWDGARCHWQVDAASDGRVSPALAGVAHGGAGMALALLALYRATRGERYLRTARGALSYTDQLYNEREGAWVDTRFPHVLDEGSADGRFQSGWCHGGAGVLLVRSLAATVDVERSEDHARYAASAALSIARVVRGARSAGLGDATLCHGHAGHGEALSEYARKVGDRSLDLACLETADAMADRCPNLSDWPSGVNAGGHNPSLMIGAAGIGYHFLRLSRPGLLPSLLTLFAG